MQDIDTFKLLLFFCNTFVILLILNNGITTCALKQAFGAH